MLSRVIVGSRDILVIAPLATLLGTVLGTAIGLVMGYYRGIVDDVLGRVVEAFLALPLIVTGVLAIAALGTSNATLIIVIGIVFTPLIARTVRAAVLQERDLDYVAAARLRGEGSLYIMFVEILPNVFSPIVVEFTVRLAYAIFTVLTLTFLGFGVQPPSPDWGLDIATNYGVVTRGLLVGGAVRRTGDRFAGRCSHPGVGVDRGSAGAMTTATEPMGSPGAEPTQADALAVDNIDVTYRVRGRPLVVVRDVSFRIARGESYGLVGESGCGKSTIALAVVRYLARNGSVSGGSISIDGRDVLAMRGGELRKLRTNTVSMVYQEPGKSLNPTIRVGPQVAEVFEIAGLGKAESLDRVSRDAREGADLRSGRGDEPLSRISSREGCCSAS